VLFAVLVVAAILLVTGGLLLLFAPQNDTSPGPSKTTTISTPETSLPTETSLPPDTSIPSAPTTQAPAP
jgi:hypothetical protein